MCPLSVWECPRRPYGTLGCPCASLACPRVRARLPLRGWSGLRLSLAAQGGDITKYGKNPKNLENRDFSFFFPKCVAGCPGVLPARLRHSSVPLRVPIRAHTP